MIDRRLITNFNWWFFSIVMFIAAIGVVTIYSANHGRPEPFFRGLYIKQIIWIFYGLLAMLVAILIDYRAWSRNAYLVYSITLLALGYTLLFGTVSSGARRWIHLGPVSIQISEFAKIALIIALAKYFEEKKTLEKYQIKDLLLPGFLTAIFCLLIALQPDLGTAMITIFIFFIFLVSAEVDQRTLIKIALTGIISFPALWFFLKDYQKTRLLTLFNPELDPLGAGYHSIQSKIAIGSGGFWGKGLFAGTQNRLNFLPEKHTDFIFSVFAEEMGFIGVIILLLLYLIIILKGLNIAFRSLDRFGLFLGLGIVSVLSFYIIVNIGMTIGFFPITGIPLPLLSYGGSSLVTNFFAIGLLLNIEIRRTIF
ncbi:MAG: rod shape-determining protein RodA [Nitrospinota bacterium]|nr:rod shape-determining protein RodA [Nitrospinota bacterium]